MGKLKEERKKEREKETSSLCVASFLYWCPSQQADEPPKQHNLPTPLPPPKRTRLRVGECHRFSCEEKNAGVV